MYTKSVKRWAFLAALASAMALSGCGSGSPHTTSNTTTGQTPSATFGKGASPEVRPSEVALSADSGNIVTKITWTSWGPESAVGIGTWEYNSCQPDCADGSVTDYSAKLTLSDVVHRRFTRVTEAQSGPHGHINMFTLPGMN